MHIWLYIVLLIVGFLIGQFLCALACVGWWQQSYREWGMISRVVWQVSLAPWRISFKLLSGSWRKFPGSGRDLQEKFITRYDPKVK